MLGLMVVALGRQLPWVGVQFLRRLGALIVGAWAS